mmetsp:Transcript_8882/g.19941  ORF Transcript_8882/g.19941 Transcript_8882/m.19941 type:complete len:799 (+) Transcript_8882:181-2577(+)|eukprot:CAMPEP_0172320428 /NCGR_PEP_ID=MMETSP1058-20130122/40563_1 /TAXON_ID=83371 /ORGANISM="Detonula confervacea, Strain CCMP 353" /LENGTH=798 /DNA_ID=CAMNT_0013035699 /DNA_START=78 /DNA_END=2474 /DNA_ORIENTATION=+
MTNSPDDYEHNDAKEVNPNSAEEEVYDVVICGTDLIQSILSSALSRAGKKVLHCDGNEWYGGFDAVLYGGSTLDSFIEGCEQFANVVLAKQGEDERADNRREDTKNVDSMQLQLLSRGEYGNLKLHSQTFIGASKESNATEGVKDDSPSDTTLQELSIEDDDKEKKGEIVNENEDTNNEVESPPVNGMSTVKPLEHGFCFDLTPCLLYAAGDAVQNLVDSGVSDYLEFKSLKGLYILMEEENKLRSGRRSRNTGKNKSKDLSSGNDHVDSGSMNGRKLATYRVPCSKGDVFRSKLLSPIDKRRLMKFLQLISDYGMASQLGDSQSSNNASDDVSDVPTEGEAAPSDDPDNTKTEPESVSGEDAIQSINEHYLHRGRALSRPQNKATPTSSEMDALMRCVRDNVSFSDFLTKVAKLPERLSTVVVYALALAPFGYLEQKETGAVSDATKRIYSYSTKEGVDDLVRHLTALGRFGDTAFLVPMYGSGELSQAFCRSGAVYGSTYMLRRTPLAISLDTSARVQGLVLGGEEHVGGSDDLDTDDVTDRKLSCKHVIVPSTMMDPTKVCKSFQARTYRRVSILQGKLMMDQDQNDTKDESDTEQRHAIIIPPGTYGLKNKSSIHGVVLDDSSFVAPPGKNYTVLHLTTSSQEDDSTPDELFVDSLSKAVEYLIDSQSSKAGDAPVKECHHISFSYSADTPSFNEEDGTNSGQPPGLHICHRDKQSLTCDSAFREAKRIFQDICPGSDFLALAKKVEDAIMYRDEHDSDDEKMVLESACTMIQAPMATEPLPGDDGVESCTDDL